MNSGSANTKGTLLALVLSIINPAHSSLIDSNDLENKRIVLSPDLAGSMKLAATVSISDVSINSASNNQENRVVISPLILTPGNADLFVKNSLQLRVSGGISPYVWKSSDPNVAMVNGSGLVATISAGSTTISVSDYENQIQSMLVTVNAPVIRIFKSKAILPLASFMILTPSGGDRVYQWQSSDESIATINIHGQLNANSPGLVTITLTDGQGTSTTTEIEIRRVSVIGPKVLVMSDKAVQLNSSGGSGPYTWRVSHNTMASIGPNGLLTALAAGTVTVTAIDSDGFMGSLDIVIEKAPLAVPVGR